VREHVEPPRQPWATVLTSWIAVVSAFVVRSTSCCNRPDSFIFVSHRAKLFRYLLSVGRSAVPMISSVLCNTAPNRSCAVVPARA
jgi:hypothetical protein